jgi:hypothetical protein
MNEYKYKAVTIWLYKYTAVIVWLYKYTAVTLSIRLQLYGYNALAYFVNDKKAL